MLEHGVSQHDRERPANVRVTRVAWLDAARSMLVSEGVDQVKVAVLAGRLGIARSSFYWYFRDRNELLGALLTQWEGLNTESIIDRAARPAPTVNSAVLNVFECWADPALFDARMEFAVRDWSRRDDAVRARLETADARRLGALTALHRRYGASPRDALVRARVQYHSQIGMYALGVDETQSVRLSLLGHYLRVFTGEAPTREELRRFRQFVRDLQHVGPNDLRV